MQTPSLVVLQEQNLILNPAHPDMAAASFRIEEEVVWDVRLFGGV